MQSIELSVQRWMRGWRSREMFYGVIWCPRPSFRFTGYRHRCSSSGCGNSSSSSSSLWGPHRALSRLQIVRVGVLSLSALVVVDAAAAALAASRLAITTDGPRQATNSWARRLVGADSVACLVLSPAAQCRPTASEIEACRCPITGRSWAVAAMRR